MNIGRIIKGVGGNYYVSAIGYLQKEKFINVVQEVNSERQK